MVLSPRATCRKGRGVSEGKDREDVGTYLKDNFNVKSLKALVHDSRERISTVLDGNLHNHHTIMRCMCHGIMCLYTTLSQ